MYYLVTTQPGPAVGPSGFILEARDRRRANAEAARVAGPGCLVESWHELQIAEHQAHVRILRAMEARAELEAQAAPAQEALRACAREEEEAKAELDLALGKNMSFHRELKLHMAKKRD